MGSEGGERKKERVKGRESGMREIGQFGSYLACWL